MLDYIAKLIISRFNVGAESTEMSPMDSLISAFACRSSNMRNHWNPILLTHFYEVIKLDTIRYDTIWYERSERSELTNVGKSTVPIRPRVPYYGEALGKLMIDAHDEISDPAYSIKYEQKF